MTNATFSFSFDFTTREEYLADRAAWKANYKALTTAQRKAKIDLKKAFRDEDFRAVVRSMSDVASNKATARELLDALASAKEEAQAQYLAAHAQKVAA